MQGDLHTNQYSVTEHFKYISDRGSLPGARVSFCLFVFLWIFWSLDFLGTFTGSTFLWVSVILC